MSTFLIVFFAVVGCAIVAIVLWLISPVRRKAMRIAEDFVMARPKSPQAPRPRTDPKSRPASRHLPSRRSSSSDSGNRPSASVKQSGTTWGQQPGDPISLVPPCLSCRREVFPGAGSSNALLGAGLGASALDLWGSDTPFHDRCDVRVARIPGPAGWGGRKIVFVTDIHYGNHFGPTETGALNALIRREKPDLVLLGGDLAQTPATDLAGFLVGWSPGCPTLFAPGNHDLEKGATSSPVPRCARPRA